VLDQTRKARTGDVQGRTWSLWFGTVVAVRAAEVAVTVSVHIPVLSVFTIAVHGEFAP